MTLELELMEDVKLADVVICHHNINMKPKH